MLEKIKKHLLPVLLIFILSLVPFVWLKNGEIILGHDAGTPLSPIEHFTDRLELWTYRYASGSDQTFAVAGFFLHGFEFLLGQLPISISDQQKIEFSTYLFLMGFSMYVSSQIILKKLQPEYALIAAIIYEFNHFILQAWFIAERTKFSVYIVMPLLTALIFMVFRKQIKPLHGGILSGLLLTVLNGGGFLPLYASLFLTAGVASLSVLLFVKPFKEKILEFVIYCGSFVATYIICNMYWLLPYYWYIKSSFSQLVGESGGLSGILNWVTSISENTSVLNLLRLQGIQEWYVNPEHPYAFHFFTNPLLVLISYIPILVLIVTFVKFNKRKSFVTAVLLLILIIALFLMGGSHKPFGFIYVLLLKYIPGFIAFRTPYYKFAPAFFFAFALLASDLASQLLNTRRYKNIAVIGILLIYLVYNFPFFTVNFFQYTHDRTTKVSVPDYVYEYSRYIKDNPDNLVKTALFPGVNPSDGTAQYTWGYWSLASLHSLLDNHQYIAPPVNVTTETELSNEFYVALFQKNPDWFEMAQVLGIDSILVEEDFNQFTTKNLNTAEVEQMLVSNPNVTLLREFGKWRIYKINTVREIHPNYVQLDIPTSKIANLNYIQDFIFNQTDVHTPFAYSKDAIDSLNRVAVLLKASCQDCQIRREQTFVATRNVIFIPGSRIGFLGKLFGIDYEHNDVPTDSLQKLYIIQALVFRKEPSSLRIPIWHKYLANLDEYEKIIENDVASSPIIHEKLINDFSNIQYQKNGIKDISVFINSVAEAELFSKALEKIQRIEQTILKTNTITVNTSKYKLAITPQEVGEYKMFVYNNLLNASKINENINLSIQGTPVSTSLSTKGDWSELGTQKFENKEYIIDIEDADFKNPENIPATVSLGSDEPCAEITKAILPKGLYSLDMSLTSSQSNANVTIHILKDGEEKPRLPYWGIPVELPQNLTINSLNAFDIYDEVETTIMLCAFTLRSTTDITIVSFDLNRQTDPVFLLYRADKQPLPVSGSYTIDRKINTQNEYKVTTTATGFLNTQHPFNVNWKVTGQEDTVIIKINENSQGIILPSGEYTLYENYSIQKYFTIGSTFSLLAGVSAIGYLTFVFYKKRN